VPDSEPGPERPPAGAGDPAEQERRRRRNEKRRERAETGAEVAAESGCSVPGCDRLGGGGRGGGSSRGGGGGCDACGCDLLLFLRLAPLLLAVAAVLPAGGSGRGLRALIRGYQRRLSRFTPACPGTPSCSAYALIAIEVLGPRHGLAAAARRIGGCGR
jgi:hypothetical protein